MKKKVVINFLAGLVISYTIEVLVMTVSVIIAGSHNVPVYMLMEGFALAACCSLIGAVFTSDRLSFLMQSLLTYFSVLAIIIIFSIMCRWYDNEPEELKGKSFFIVIISLFTIIYILIIGIRLALQKKDTKLMNEKLTEYKEKNKRKEGKHEWGQY
ncbi:MAG: DUF3021 domain-containing protein [Lachnoclostridium sp.]|jgi:hypothetical protein